MKWRNLREICDSSSSIDDATACQILTTPAAEIPEMLATASFIRRKHFGDRFNACSIINARSGACGEDCAFCAQSAHHRTGTETYPLLDNDRLTDAYRQSSRHPIRHFGIVTSGGTLDTAGTRKLADLAAATGEINGVHWCASLGALPESDLRKLCTAGFRRYHHNIETAPDFFSKICSTHTFEDRLQTIRNAKSAGLEVCSGGILGMGETLEQRVGMARILADEKVDAIPLNFLIPVPGTRLETMPPMAPLDILRTIAMFRIVCRTPEIKVCAGRLLLRDLQSMVFYAGATGIMIGDLLTVAGRKPCDDIRMLKDLEVFDD